MDILDREMLNIYTSIPVPLEWRGGFQYLLME
jgi:hypothetical protein